MDLWLDVLIYPPEEANQGCTSAAALSIYFLTISRLPLTSCSALLSVAGTISIDEHTSASMLKQIPLGTLEPSANLSKTLTLLAEGLPTTFQIDVSVQSRLTVSPSSPTLATVPSPQQSSSSRPASPSQPEAEPELEPATEHLHTLTVPAILPFRVSFDSRRFPSRQPRRSLLDPSGFEEGGEWEKEEEAGVTLKVDTIGDWDVEVVEVKFKEGSRKFARGTFNSLDGGVATFPKGLSATTITVQRGYELISGIRYVSIGSLEDRGSLCSSLSFRCRLGRGRRRPRRRRSSALERCARYFAWLV
jgi:hypothetical protein